MTINALDSNLLTPAERDAIKNYTLDVDIRSKLNAATADAIAKGESLYLPAGLWLIKANTRTTVTSGWGINVPDRRSLLIFGDGDATIVRRQGTPQMDAGSRLVQIVANNANQLTFQNLLFDGNEANCPIDEGVVFNADGVTKQFAYQVEDQEKEKGIGVTLTINGIELRQSSRDYTRGGSYPSRFVIFANAPRVGTKIRIHKPFFYEQSANVSFATGSGIPNNITFENVTMTGCVGDGFKTNVPIQSLQVTNWRSYGRTRRPRADIQLSRIPLQATNITNFIGDAFEMEPKRTANAEHIINLSNMLIRGAFDLAGDEEAHSDGTPANFANVNANNIKHLGQFGVGLPFSNFFGVRGEFNNCSFVDTNRIQNCEIRFNGGSFAVSGKIDKPTTAEDIRIFHGADGKFVEFNSVTFKVRGTGVKSGAYFRENEAKTEFEPQTWFINCRASDELDYFAASNRNGTMLFDGGQLKGKVAAILIENGSGSDSAGKPYVTKAIIKNLELWSSKSAIEIGSTSGPIQIEMSGYFNAETIQPSANSRPLTSPNITWVGGFGGSVTSDPNGRIFGLPGLILRKSEPTVSDQIVEWRYQKGKTYAEKDYVALVHN
jgi:hypothetical protein